MPFLANAHNLQGSVKIQNEADNLRTIWCLFWHFCYRRRHWHVQPSTKWSASWRRKHGAKNLQKSLCVEIRNGWNTLWGVSVMNIYQKLFISKRSQAVLAASLSRLLFWAEEEADEVSVYAFKCVSQRIMSLRISSSKLTDTCMHHISDQTSGLGNSNLWNGHACITV